MRGYKIDLSMLNEHKRNSIAKQIIDIVVNKYGLRRPKECIGNLFLFFNGCSRSRVLYGTTFSYFDAHTYREITWKDFIEKHSWLSERSWFNDNTTPEIITWQDFLEKYESSKLTNVNCRCATIPKRLDLGDYNVSNVSMFNKDIEGMKLPRCEGYRKPAKQSINDRSKLRNQYYERKEVENIRIPDDGPIPYLIGWF